MTVVQMATSAHGEPLPFRVEISDLENLESTVRTFRALDYRHGGESCRAALEAIGSWTILLRKGTVPSRLRRRLSGDLSDLYNLLAWTEFDTGRFEHARRHFALAAELAAEAGNAELTANICYRRGRLHLHRREVDAALAEFGRGQMAARRAGSPHAEAVLAANQAWAYAMRADEAQALAHLGRAADAFAATTRPPPPWASFFDTNDLAAMTGTVRVELARTAGGRHAAEAIPALTEAVAGYGAEMARSCSLTQSLLALAHALERDFAEALRAGVEAIRIAQGVRSVRTVDRLDPVESVVRAGRPGAAGRELLDQIGRFRAESTG